MADTSNTSTSFNPSRFVPDHVRYGEYVRKWHRDARRNRREEYFADKQCVMCGAKSFLEIHHRDPNQKVDHRHIWHWKKKRRDEELAKCDVLCDVCHDSIHAYEMALRRGWVGQRNLGTGNVA